MRYLIAHAPHARGRSASLTRLHEQFRDGVDILASRGPEHASIWARRIWEYAAKIDDHVCILNDDVRILPGGLDYIERAVEAVPDECLSLHCTNPNADVIEGAWARCYHYTGPGVVLPPGAAASLLEYVYSLPWSLVSRTNEDNLAILWAWSRQRPFWYLLPAPVRHDVSVPSTLGYDHHPNRVPSVTGPPRDLRVENRDAVPWVELSWALAQTLDYRRNVLRAGRMLCMLCVGREGVVGDIKQGVTVCQRCLHELNNAAMAALR